MKLRWCSSFASANRSEWRLKPSTSFPPLRDSRSAAHFIIRRTFALPKFGRGKNERTRRWFQTKLFTQLLHGRNSRATLRLISHIISCRSTRHLISKLISLASGLAQEKASTHKSHFMNNVHWCWKSVDCVQRSADIETMKTNKIDCESWAWDLLTHFLGL